MDYLSIIDEQQNNTFSTSSSMDLNSLYTRQTPQDLTVVNYSGTLAHNLFVEGLFSERHYTLQGHGRHHRPTSSTAR